MAKDRREWSNWSGSVRFSPRATEAPTSEEEIVQIVRRAAEEGQVVRPIGAAHSSTGILETHDVAVSFENMKGLISYDATERVATLRPGTSVRETGEELLEVGLSMENLGDVDYQTIAGGIGTGTHGTGKRYTNLSGPLIGARLVTGRGDILELTAERDAELLDAARVSLGALGIFSAVTLRTARAHRLRRREWCTHIDHGLANLEELIDANQHFDLYWYPRSDEAKLRLWNPAEREARDIPHARLVKDETGWSKDVLPNPQELRFEEMEYALPAAAGPPCFLELRRRIVERHRQHVGWRVLYRTVAPDGGYLSPFYGRDSVTIALLQNNTLPYREYFEDLEPLFRAYGGRPHWGKKHGLKARELRAIYPEWDRFAAIRARLDPHDTLLSEKLRELLVEAS
jgi:FAD/FMN-containing dehydrogenase